MTALAATSTRAPAPNPFRLFRDDGPLAVAIGRLAGRRVPVPAAVLVAAGILPVLVAVVLRGDGAPDALAAAAVAWLVVLGGTASGRPANDRLRWLVPSLLRVAEYGTLLWLAALAGDDGPPGAFALMAVLTFRHYDLVYRLRYQGVAPPRWIGTLAGGWEGRLVFGVVALAVGAVPEALFVAAGVLAVAFVGESVASWRRVARAGAAQRFDDDEDEDEAD